MSSCGWFPLSQQEIGEWLDRHPEALPRSLDDLAPFPMAFRRVMVNRVAPEVRIALWREHLGSFLRRDVELTEPQRRLIDSAIARMPELVGEGDSRRAILELEREAAAVFSREEMQLLLATIGAPEPPGGLPLPHGARR